MFRNNTFTCSFHFDLGFEFYTIEYINKYLHKQLALTISSMNKLYVNNKPTVRFVLRKPVYDLYDSFQTIIEICIYVRSNRFITSRQTFTCC